MQFSLLPHASDPLSRLGKFALRLLTIQHDRYDGTQTTPINRIIFDRGNSVAVLLHDKKDDTVILTEQFRPGVAAADADDSPWVVELVAGSMDVPGESPEEVARREVEEEAPGCEILAIREIGAFYSSPGACSEKVFLFYAQVDSSKAAETGGLRDHEEDIRILRVPVAEALKNLRAGKYNTTQAIIGLSWLDRHAVRYDTQGTVFSN